MNSISSANNTRLVATFIILFTGFLFLFNTENRDLWAPDEPRYAQVAKEMRDSSNFLVPHLNKEPYPDKPPFLFWLINVFSLPFGKVTPLSSRLPSAFAGIGCCLAIFYFGKNLYRNTRIALLAALILATSIKFLWMAHRVAFDVFLLLRQYFLFIKDIHSSVAANLLFPLPFPIRGMEMKKERKAGPYSIIPYFVFLWLSGCLPRDL